MTNGAPLFENTSVAEKICPYSGARASSRTPTPDSTHATRSSRDSGSTAPTSQVNFDNLSIHESKCPVIFTQEVDPLLIKTSLEDRVAYLTDFLGFTSYDADVIKKVAPHVNEIIPGLVDDLYAKLFEFDITKKVFMTRNQGFDGPLPSKLEDLTLDSAQITFRKVFMKVWARRVLTADYSSGKTWAYMDKVGIMHTGVSPFKHQKTMGIAPLNVPYRDCALTLGWIHTLIGRAILSLPEQKADMALKMDATAAINKVIWIQNDLFSRHYINE
ncbi:Protoglobin-domain-containing protein [Irpex rosettiformis]|uniref:Protoglobin-domain-containing protein n=1 Tax=Irpex rosettiformis TaxID=378272 RepID=A0ACB8U4D9_9APHY|nr:Protoglobin-domain-containing protein [Irpex rosettiformis]